MMRRVTLAAIVCASLAASACSNTGGYRTYATPEDAVRALNTAVKAGNVDEVASIFGPEGRALIDSSDAATARRNREIFTAAVRERWRLEEQAADRRVLVIGNEDWPFPVPLVKDGSTWRFDTGAGKEEILNRRIGRNELSAILICRTYVVAQDVYARRGHDGAPAGIYAAAFTSEPGKENGLYWPAGHGARRSPLGDLVARAAEQGTALGKDDKPTPFHGYYFKILTRQGAAAPGGARDYVVNGRMSGGFALIAWPAEYDATGVMTFVVNGDGVVREKDLGPDTANAARQIAAYDPDASWTAAGLPARK
jgi:Protein of unknown function (DUF2950)